MSDVGERNSPRLKRRRTAYRAMLLEQISELYKVSACLEKNIKLSTHLLRIVVAQGLALNYVEFNLSEERSVALVFGG